MRSETYEVRLVRTDQDVHLDVRVQRGAEAVVELPDGLSGLPIQCFTELLGLILGQAFLDGMTGISLGWDASSTCVSLSYIRESAGGDISRWAVTAPPSDAYAPLVRAIVEATRMCRGVEARGTMNAVINGHPLNVRVELDSWYKVEMTWSRPGIPE